MGSTSAPAQASGQHQAFPLLHHAHWDTHTDICSVTALEEPNAFYTH